MPTAAAKSDVRTHALAEEIAQKQVEAFAGKAGGLLNLLDGFKVPKSFETAFREMPIQSRSEWASAVFKLIRCRNHAGMVCVLIGIKDWRELVLQARSEEVFSALKQLAQKTLVPRSKGKPYAFVLYAGEVPSKVRPNTSVAFFCVPPADEAQVLLNAICEAATETIGRC